MLKFELHEHFALERRNDQSSEIHTVGLSGSLKKNVCRTLSLPRFFSCCVKMFIPCMYSSFQNKD